MLVAGVWAGDAEFRFVGTALLVLIATGLGYLLTAFAWLRSGGPSDPGPRLFAALHGFFLTTAAFPALLLGVLSLRWAAEGDAFFGDRSLRIPEIVSLGCVVLVVAGAWLQYAVITRERRRRAVSGELVDVGDAASKQEIERLSQLAFHDGLTGLPNRIHFKRELEALCTPGASFVVMFFDFDKFKSINDIHGHAIGDLFLVTVAKRMKSVLRAGDLAARFGGDEFAVLVRGESAREAAMSMARRFVAVLSEPYQFGDVTVRSSASIGIAMSDGRGNTAAELIHAADMAMFEAKRAGGARFVVASSIERLPASSAMA